MKNLIAFVLCLITLLITACGLKVPLDGDGNGTDGDQPQVQIINQIFVFECRDDDLDGRCLGQFEEQCDAPGLTPEQRADCRERAETRVGTNVQGLAGGDCNDRDGTVYGADPRAGAVAAPELCDGADNDCDRQVDEAITCGCLADVNCSDRLFCTGQERCVGTATTGRSCQAGAVPCVGTATPVCDEAGDRCVGCVTDATCSDGQFCNGAERCVMNICGTGTPPCGNTATCIEATDSCASCNDGNACTNDSVSMAGTCINAGRANCCNPLVVCATGMCTSRTATVAGICVGCLSDADCANDARCNPATNSCEVCDDGNACTTNGRNNRQCVYTPVAGCCTATSQCAMGVCTSNMPTVPGQCVGCTQDTHCAATEVCQTNRCVAVACADDGNACTVETVVNRMCTRPIPAGCCRGPTDDAACIASRPASLSMEYLWGCSTSSTATTTPSRYRCTSCRDEDRDGRCSILELCANRLDDDGDGLTDETPCLPPTPADAGVMDAGAVDSGMTVDSGMVDSGPADSGVTPDAGVLADSGVPQCTTDVQCGAGRFCAGGTCAAFVDQRGRTPYGASGANGGPLPDGTPDARDDDGDGFCEVAPCTGGSRNPAFASMSLLGGDCDDDPGDSTPFTVTTAAGSFTTDGSFGNHPGVTEFCESPSPGFDNDCDGTPNDGC